LDLVIGNAISPYLRDYDKPMPFNIFHLPQPEYPGDRRMFDFMHRTWHDANNGGGMTLWRNTGSRFEKIPADRLGMGNDHRWTTAIGFADINGDGWADIYASNDFGPDQLLINQHDGSFKPVRGPIIGQMGHDTYKGMNVTVADFDNNGRPAIYVSNVHENLQAEGSLLWTQTGDPTVADGWTDRAVAHNVLNEKRFGWGAAAGDIDLDGRLDILQANGMVDNTYDPLYPGCPDYWYWNDKIALTRPDIHGYADRWADLRGRCIFPNEKNRVYLNHGQYFVDVASQVGWDKPGNARGIALVDLDNDGRLDALVTHQFAPLSIFHNVSKTSTRHDWIGLQLEGNGTTCNRDAIGTKVTIEYGEGNQVKTQTREVLTLNGFSAQGDRRLLFGLGTLPAPDQPVTVKIQWCGQSETETVALHVGRYHKLTHAKYAQQMAQPVSPVIAVAKSDKR